MKPWFYYFPVLALFFLLAGNSQGQNKTSAVIQTPVAGTTSSGMQKAFPPRPSKWIPYNRSLVSKIPVLTMPEKCKRTPLPAVVDNSVNPCFSGILDQAMFCSCEQYAGVAFNFGYEINRLRSLDGKLPENLYPTHYTYNFYNNSDWTVGVSFFHSFDVLKKQGQMTMNDYGSDSAMNAWGWPSGYDKYYRGMHNRLGGLYSIPLNTEEGQNTLKHYLYDHLEGSSVGGVALFGASAPYGPNFRALPQGTPEAGKPVLIYFDWYADHGGTVIGYNDSIRFDLNNDGRYTNDEDINGDGIVDIRDWEIGGFRIANSYGVWWGDQGFYYILYSTMALPYGQGGVEDGNVIVLEPLAAYQPRLTMKASLQSECRGHLRVRAGVSRDTSIQFPGFIMDFPVFNFQGARRPMQGFDSIPGSDTLEFGLDVTPLLSYIEPGEPTRFFLMVDNQDSMMNKGGNILHVSFINYQDGGTVYLSPQHDVPIVLNSLTLASVAATMNFDKIRITTPGLPVFIPGQPYQCQLQSSGGTSPCKWSLLYPYLLQHTDSVFTRYPGTFPVLPNINTPYTPVVLPFHFPFCGKEYDTVWVNTLGLVSFEHRDIPFPYTIDDYSMLKSVASIFPAFSRSYFTGSNPDDSLCISISPKRIIFRWYMGVTTFNGTTKNNIELVLYPDGRFEFRYGEISNSGIPFPVYSGYSRGDEDESEIIKTDDRTSLQGQSLLYNCPLAAGKLSISEQGLLSFPNADSTRVYAITARVEDICHMSDTKEFQLSSGISLNYSFGTAWEGFITYNTPVAMNISVTNNSQQELRNMTVRLMCDNPAISLQDSLKTISLLSPGNTQEISSAFSFTLKTQLTDKSQIRFILKAEAGTRSWTEEFFLPVSSPDINASDARIVDGDNHTLDPGEIAEMEVSLINSGQFQAENFTLSFQAMDDHISILSDPDIQVANTGPLNLQKFRILLQASRTNSPGQSGMIQLHVHGGNVLDREFQFILPLGKKFVALARLSQGSVSLDPMKAALDSLKVPYDTYMSSAFNINLYQSVFLLMGTTSNEHVLSNQESIAMANYLDQGGNLYMECYSMWGSTTPRVVMPYFRYTSNRVPAFFYDRIKGSPGTFCDGMKFQYTSSVTGQVHTLEPRDSAWSTLTNNGSPPASVEVVNNGNGYKTIGTLAEFGSLQDSLDPSNQLTLMKRYIGFFNLNITGPYPMFHATKTDPVCNDTLTFIDDSYSGIVSRHWEFPGGTPALSTDRNPVVYYSGKGDFDVTLTVSDGQNTKSLTRKKFIHIAFPAGVHETIAGRILVFPNPAKDQAGISFPSDISGTVSLEVLDMFGNPVIVRTVEIFPGSDVILNTASLSMGLYIIKARSGDKQWVSKLLVQ